MTNNLHQLIDQLEDDQVKTARIFLEFLIARQEQEAQWRIVQKQQMDQMYREGYKNHPETSETGEVQVKFLADVLSPEHW